MRGDVVRVTEETYTLEVDDKHLESFAGKPLRVTGGSLFFGGSVSLLMYGVTLGSRVSPPRSRSRGGPRGSRPWARRLHPAP